MSCLPASLFLITHKIFLKLPTKETLFWFLTSKEAKNGDIGKAVCVSCSIVSQFFTKIKGIFPCMEKYICKNMTRVCRCCITCRIVRLMKLLWTHLCDGKGLQLSLVQKSICTSLSYSREATKQEVTYSCRSTLVCRAVSSCAATSSLSRKLWNPLWEEAKAGAQAMLSGFNLPQDSTASRKMSSALTHPKAGETEVGGSGCGSEAAALAKLLLGVDLHH